jgi:hypothetical protein
MRQRAGRATDGLIPCTALSFAENIESRQGRLRTGSAARRHNELGTH